MDAVNNGCEVRREQGFEIYALNNQEVEIAVVPELGARILSLKNLRTGREWLWHPGDKLKLFRNRPGDAFESSTLAGIDECFPTIASCQWRERQLPDHGELWAAPWQIEVEAWRNGILSTRVSLELSPFTFERTIELQENEARISYRLLNRGDSEEHFLWAMHPLLRLQPGDQLQLPASTRALLNGTTWLQAVDTVIPGGGCEKLFAAPIADAVAGIHNSRTGDRLTFEWDASENNTLGLWLTRGGWHGHHHFALEPANGQPDALTTAIRDGRCGVIAAQSLMKWRVLLRLGL